MSRAVVNLHSKEAFMGRKTKNPENTRRMHRKFGFTKKRQDHLSIVFFLPKRIGTDD